MFRARVSHSPELQAVKRLAVAPDARVRKQWIAAEMDGDCDREREEYRAENAKERNCENCIEATLQRIVDTATATESRCD
jgi:hypothetical protein